MATAPYPIMNMKDGSTKMSDGSIILKDWTVQYWTDIRWKQDTSWQTPVWARSMSAWWVISASAWTWTAKKNIPSSTVNKTTWFDWSKYSFPTGAAANVPTVAQTWAWTTSIKTDANKPVVVQPKPTTLVSSMAGRKNIPTRKVDSNIVKIPEAEWVLQDALNRWLQSTTTTPTTAVSSMAGRVNVPKSTSIWATTTTPIIEWPSAWAVTVSVAKKWKTPEEIYAEKEKELTKMKESDIAAKNLELQKWTDVLKTNNKLLMRLYGIDEKWNVDTTNPNGLAAKIEKSKADYQNTKNQLLSEYSSARLRKVQSQMRQMLSSRGIDITKIPQEQLIQLSWEVWTTAFNDIFTAKEKTVNDILVNWAAAEDKINALREKWLISQNDLRISLETLRSKVLGDINTINKQFANDIFGLKDKTTADIEARKAAAINSITQLWASLWLTGTKLWVLTSYMNNFNNATDALTAMTIDLSNPQSALYKTVGSVEMANLLARQASAALEQRKVAATELTAKASAIRAQKDTWDKVPSTIAPIISAILQKPLQDVTMDDYTTLIQSDTAQWRSFRDALSKWTIVTQ